MTRIPTWIVDHHYTPADAQNLRDELARLSQTLRGAGTFISDNLFTFGKSLRFLKDAKFAAAFLAANPSREESALVWRKHTLYWAAQRAMKLQGDFVEAACYQGFTAQVLCNAFDLRSVGKQFWLYDRFESAAADEGWMPGHSQALFEQVQARFINDPVTVIKGNLPGALAQGAPELISLLHVDMNSAAAETAVLDALFDRVEAGGVIILDDYGWAAYAEQTDAHDAWFGARAHGILELPTGQGLVIKEP